MALRRAILLACAAMMSAHPRCEAFSLGRPTAPPTAHPSYEVRSSSPHNCRHHPPSSATTTGVALAAALSRRAGVDVEDRSRSNIVRITTHEEYLEFLQQDDRACVISELIVFFIIYLLWSAYCFCDGRKSLILFSFPVLEYFADWCKSCSKFGAKYRHLAHDLGDVIDLDGGVVRSGDVRFAEVEYTVSARLCKTLKVNKLPTVHIYRAGSGKVVDMTCKPSLFHLVVDELRRVLDGSSSGASDADDAEAEADTNDEAAMSNRGDIKTNASFDVTMVAGSSLGEEIVASLKKKKNEDEGAKKETNWFWK